MVLLRPPRLAMNLSGWIPRIEDIAQENPLFDTLTATAGDLQRELTAGRLTSVQIVRQYCHAIFSFNGYLNAVYELAPGAIQQAESRDKARAEGRVLGALHGIPILLKDNINTGVDLQMGTRAGGLALVNATAKGNAPIVDRLIEAGAIIMGKSTMSEYAYFKGSGIRCGWSALAGQCQNPYVSGGDKADDGLGGHSSTGGSSSGSAVSVSAGLAPIAIGTETEGSLVVPATRAGLYTLKPTLGLILGEGIVPITPRFDTAGPMAKCVKDIADLLTELVDPSKTNVPEGGYSAAIGNADSWKEIRVGTLKPDEWLPPDGLIKPVAGATTQILQETQLAYDKIRGLAKSYHENVTLRSDRDFFLDGENALSTMMVSDFEEAVNHFLADLETSKVRTLAEVVEWNSAHADEALSAEYPKQDLLERALNAKFSKEKVDQTLKHIETVGASFDETIAKYDLDVIIGPTDSLLSAFSASQGCPIATLPLAYLDYNGRPISLLAAAPRHHEATLIKLMGAFECSFPKLQPPSELLAHRADL
ncbi:hypothetical protein FQN54_005397 [Arachnomyces sp. PD_36]|nr:hypothetical protein FQN54_005397 [Arachnomyces sp. PD_36]